MFRWLPRRFRWAIIAAGAYLTVSVPSAALYLLRPHEYSIPGFVLFGISLPGHVLLFGLLRPLTLPIERLAGGELIAVLLLLVVTAAIYFGFAFAVAWTLASLRHRRGVEGKYEE